MASCSGIIVGRSDASNQAASQMKRKYYLVMYPPDQRGRGLEMGEKTLVNEDWRAANNERVDSA